MNTTIIAVAFTALLVFGLTKSNTWSDRMRFFQVLVAAPFTFVCMFWLKYCYDYLQISGILITSYHQLMILPAIFFVCTAIFALIYSVCNWNKQNNGEGRMNPAHRGGIINSSKKSLIIISIFLLIYGIASAVCIKASFFNIELIISQSRTYPVAIFVATIVTIMFASLLKGAHHEFSGNNV